VPQPDSYRRQTEKMTGDQAEEALSARIV